MHKKICDLYGKAQSVGWEKKNTKKDNYFSGKLNLNYVTDTPLAKYQMKMKETPHFSDIEISLIVKCK